MFFHIIYKSSRFLSLSITCRRFKNSSTCTCTSTKQVSTLTLTFFLLESKYSYWKVKNWKCSPKHLLIWEVDFGLCCKVTLWRPMYNVCREQTNVSSSSLPMAGMKCEKVIWTAGIQMKWRCDRSSVGRALQHWCRGRGFESHWNPDHFFRAKICNCLKLRLQLQWREISSS